jgi:hypothetical protein
MDKITNSLIGLLSLLSVEASGDELQQLFADSQKQNLNPSNVKVLSAKYATKNTPSKNQLTLRPAESKPVVEDKSVSFIEFLGKYIAGEYTQPLFTQYVQTARTTATSSSPYQIPPQTELVNQQAERKNVHPFFPPQFARVPEKKRYVIHSQDARSQTSGLKRGMNDIYNANKHYHSKSNACKKGRFNRQRTKRS